MTLAQLTASTAVDAVDPSHLYLCRYGVVAAAAHRPHLSFPSTRFHVHSGLSTPTSFTTDDVAIDNAYTPFAVVNFNAAWRLTPLLAVDEAALPSSIVVDAIVAHTMRVLCRYRRGDAAMSISL